ncbi:MAG: copper-binding protein [Acidobacteriota bacterium]|nr:copper-binding protein [Acidobacteriota bacterium]
MTSARQFRTGWLAVVLAAAILVGCGHPEPASSTAALAHSYSVRGIIRQLPSHAGVPLLIEHEAIPDFTNIRGEPAPMAAMTMPFTLADGHLLESLDVGDMVRFEISVDWDSAPAVVIDSIEALPPTTRLELGRSAASKSP